MNILIERDQLKFIKKKLDDAVNNGIGSTIFLTGEPGSGKSTVISKFLEECDKYYDVNILTGWGRCLDMDGISRGFLPWKEILIEVEADKAAGKDQEKKLNFKKVIKAVFDDAGPEWVQSIDVIGDIAAAVLKTAKDITKTEEIDVLNGTVKKLKFGERVLKAFSENTGAWLGAIPMIGGFFEALFKTSKSLIESEKKNYLRSQEDFFLLVSQKFRDLAKENPLVIVLDDLHWADRSSINLLFYLSKNLKDKSYPLVLIGTYRKEALKEGRINIATGLIERHPLIDKINNLIRYEAASEIELNNYTFSEAQKFISECFTPNDFKPEFINNLYQTTGGNPLFLNEILKYLRDSGLIQYKKRFFIKEKYSLNNLPKSVTAVIKERYDKLDKDYISFLEAACVQGTRYSVDLVAKILGENPVKIERINRDLSDNYNIIEKSATINDFYKDYYQFKNSLYQNFIYGTMSETYRNRIHGLIAEEYKNGKSEDMQKQFAYHFGVSRKIIEFNGKISDNINLISQKDIDCYTETIKKLCLKYISSFRNDEAIQYCEEIVQIAKKTNQRNIEADMLYHHAKIEQIIGKWDEAIDKFKNSFELIKNDEKFSQKKEIAESLAGLLLLKSKSLEKKYQLDKAEETSKQAYEFIFIMVGNDIDVNFQLKKSVLLNLSWILFLAGKYKDAINYIDKYEYLFGLEDEESVMILLRKAKKFAYSVNDEEGVNLINKKLQNLTLPSEVA